MPNKIDWKSIPGLVGDVIDELISLPVDAAKDAFNYLKDNKSKAAELASASVRTRHDIIAGISPNTNVRPDRQRVEVPGAPTADATTPTFAGLSPDGVIEGLDSPGSSIGNATFAGSAEAAAIEKTVSDSPSSTEQRDAWIKNKTAKKDDKIVGLFGSINEDELFNISEDELSKMVESVTGNKPSGIFDIRDNALTLLEEAKKLQTSRSR